MGPFKKYSKMLTYYDYMINIPKNFDNQNWLCVVKPLGERVLIISRKQMTFCIDLTGNLKFTFYSLLPNGCPKNLVEKSIVLDCILNKHTNTFYIMDVIFWRGVNYTNHEAALRFHIR